MVINCRRLCEGRDELCVIRCRADLEFCRRSLGGVEKCMRLQRWRT